MSMADLYKGYFLGLTSTLTNQASALRMVVKFPEEIPDENGHMVPFELLRFFDAVADLETQTEGWGLYLWWQNPQGQWVLGYTEGVEPLYDLTRWRMAAEILRSISVD